MSVTTCKTCGSEMSSLARCPSCGAAITSGADSGMKISGLRKLAPFVLGVLAIFLSVPSLFRAEQAHEDRVARLQADSARDAQLDSARHQAEERSFAIARADSILRTTPISKIHRMKTEKLEAALGAVDVRSDAAAKAWARAGKKELRSRSSR